MATKIAIFATDLSHAFGMGGGLPWPYNRTDMAFFLEKTTGTILVCGSKTYETIKHLPKRGFIVVSSNPEYGLIKVAPNKLVEFIREADANLSIVGGTSILTPEVLASVDKIYVTVFRSVNKADVFVPKETMCWLSQKPYNILYEDHELIIKEFLN